MITLIDDIFDNITDIQSEEYNIREIKNVDSFITILLSENDINKQIEYIEQYSELNDITDVVHILGKKYTFTGIKNIEELLLRICSSYTINTIIKITCIDYLLSYKEFELTEEDEENVNIRNSINEIRNKNNKEHIEKAFDMLILLCQNFSDISTTIKLNLLIKGLECDKHQKSFFTIYITDILENINIECIYRYKTIINLSNNKNINNIDNLCQDAFYTFLLNSNNDIYYRILSTQILLKSTNNDIVSKTESILLDIANDVNIDYNRRADSADILLKSSNPITKSKAVEIINYLGKNFGVVHNIFDNAQNVHTIEIEKSVEKVLEYLSLYDTMCINKTPITFSYVNDCIRVILEKNKEFMHVSTKGKYSCKYCSTKTNNDDLYCSPDCSMYYSRDKYINTALDRIYIDKMLYSKYNLNLSNILIKIWSYIQNNPNKDEMINRLIEELEEMSQTCSTGFASRLVNTISGFGEFNMEISWLEQVKANFTGRLNAKARMITDKSSIYYNSKKDDVVKLWLNSHDDVKKDIIKKMNKETISENPTMQQVVKYYLSSNEQKKVKKCVEYFSEQVLNEMSVKSSQHDKRLNFTLFFISSISSLHEELFKEFTEYISETDFDLFFRKAIAIYDGETI